MGKSFYTNAATHTLFNSTVRYHCFGNSTLVLLTATELVAKTYINQNCTVEKLKVNVTANTRTAGTAQVIVRKGSTDTGCFVDIPFGVTGIIDSTGTASITAGDLVTYKYTYGTGGTGAITYRYITTVLDFTGSTTSFLINNNIGSLSTGDRFAPLMGSGPAGGATSETTIQQKMKGGKHKNLTAYVASNSRDGDSIVTTRHNTLTGNLQLDILDSVTGYFTDVGADETPISNNYAMNYKLVRGGSGGAISISWLASEILTTDGSFVILGECLTAFSPVGATTYYLFLGGNQNTLTTDAGTKTDIPVTGYKCNGLKVNIQTNTVASASTVTLRRNGVDAANTITIPASTTGYYQDDTNETTFDLGDDVNIKVAAGGTGSLLVRSIGTFWESSSTPSTSNSYNMFFRLMR
jgi:hypothetical protein